MATVSRTAKQILPPSFVIAALLMAGAALVPVPADGKECSASVNGEVTAGKWKMIRLRNLPKGTKLSLNVTVSGEAAILLLGGEGYAQLPPR